MGGKTIVPWWRGNGLLFRNRNPAVTLYVQVSYVFRLFSLLPITSQQSISPPAHRLQDKRALPGDLQICGEIEELSDSARLKCGCR